LREKYVLELVIACGDEEFIEALKRALEPETREIKESCRVFLGMDLAGGKLTVKMECFKINDLRAMFNSYYSAISSILHVWEGEICHNNSYHRKFNKR